MSKCCILRFLLSFIMSVGMILTTVWLHVQNFVRPNIDTTLEF